jgi:hypothetical protein
MAIQRIDSSKLLEILFLEEKSPCIKVVLSDNPIFQKKVSDLIFEQTTERPILFSGKSAIQEYINHISESGMFGSPQKSIVCLSEKWTQKQWDEERKILSRLPQHLESSAYFFAPCAFRNTIKEADLPQSASFYLCYDANETDLQRCAEILLSRNKNLGKKSPKERSEICYLALESYSGDLLSCDMHFERMEKAGFSFQEALSGSPEISSFAVVDAVAQGDKHLIELRINQCADCGEEAFSIFMALSYFLKQVIQVQAALAETGNLRSAFDKAKTPFPAQKRIEKALKILTVSKLTSFFLAASKIEMELRLQKHPHHYLSAELIGWI